MNIQIISSIRFKATADGSDFRGECTVTTPDGKTAYANLTGTALQALLSANKAAGGRVRGYSQQVTLKRPVNGQPAGTTVNITEYTTDVLRFSGDLLGSYLDNPQNITLAGNRMAAADVNAFITGVTVVPSTRIPKAAVAGVADAADVDLA